MSTSREMPPPTQNEIFSFQLDFLFKSFFWVIFSFQLNFLFNRLVVIIPDENYNNWAFYLIGRQFFSLSYRIIKHAERNAKKLYGCKYVIDFNRTSSFLKIDIFIPKITFRYIENMDGGRGWRLVLGFATASLYHD